jgi:hypothetical protein
MVALARWSSAALYNSSAAPRQRTAAVTMCQAAAAAKPDSDLLLVHLSDRPPAASNALMHRRGSAGPAAWLLSSALILGLGQAPAALAGGAGDVQLGAQLFNGNCGACGVSAA